MILIVLVISLTYVFSDAQNLQQESQGVYIATVGDDSSFDLFSVSEKEAQWLQANTKYACENFKSSKPVNKPDFCLGSLPQSRIGMGGGGFFSWDIVLPVKPTSDLTIKVQCAVLLPNETNINNCSGETGQVVGPGCSRGVKNLNYWALPTIEAKAYPGPFAETGFKMPFHLTAMRNPGVHGYWGYHNSDNKPHQVLDGSKGSRISLKACFQKAIFVSIPANGRFNTRGQTEWKLNEGDLIRVIMTVPLSNTVDIYCSKASVTAEGIGEHLSFLQDAVYEAAVCYTDRGPDGILGTADDRLICDKCPETLVID